MAATKPIATKNLAKADQPIPSQGKADGIREETVQSAAEPAAKMKAAAATSDAPYPSQADLDAIKDGTFKRRTRDMQADAGSATYKTR